VDFYIFVGYLTTLKEYSVELQDDDEYLIKKQEDATGIALIEVGSPNIPGHSNVP
jgi:hypothetical protein